MVHCAASPEFGDHLQALVEAPCLDDRIDDLAERRQFVHTVVSQADTEHQPPATESIEGGALPGQLLWTAPGERRHEQPDPHPLGRDRDGRQAHPRVGNGETCLPLDVVPQEHALPAPSLGLARESAEQTSISQFPERGDEEGVLHRIGREDRAADIAGSYPAMSQPLRRPDVQTLRR